MHRSFCRTHEGNGTVTSTAVLKKARKKGVKLAGTHVLRVPELKSTFTYLKQNDSNPKVVKLAGAWLDFQAQKVTEPDFFR